jgi:hypothetical protein
MKNKNLLLQLQKTYRKGGYALVSADKNKVVAFGSDLKSLYAKIDEKGIKDADKVVMHIPPPHVQHVFTL